jgi:acetyl esterase/lipase
VADVLTVPVYCRNTPVHLSPAAYDDCRAALRWASAAQNTWLTEDGDASHFFITGDNAGGNIVHNVLLGAAVSEPGCGG